MWLNVVISKPNGALSPQTILILSPLKQKRL